MENDKRCGNCKYWEGPNDENYHWSSPCEFGTCKRALEYFGMTQDQREDDGNKMAVQDGSDYMAALLTKDDFACISWEPA